MRSLTGLIRPRTCDQPTEDGGRCQEHPTGGYNPLGFCEGHLSAYHDCIRRHGGQVTPIGEWPTFTIDFAGGDPMHVIGDP